MMVGNLGAYQIMTTLAKRVGGPVNLGGIIALISIAGGGILAYGCKEKIEHIVHSVKDKPSISCGSKESQKEIRTYCCHSDCEISNELTLEQNDQFSVLYADDKMTLIAIVGDDSSPYIVDRKKLESVSNYKVQTHR